MDFLLLSQLGLTPPVIEIHYGKRLDEQSRAAAGLVMNQAGDAPFELGAQGDDVTALALGDDRLLQKGRVGWGVDDASQIFQQSAMRLP